MSVYSILTNVVFCLSVIGFKAVVEAAFLRCYNGSLDNPLITPLESPLPLIQNGSCINTNRPTKFFISGFDRNVTSDESVGFMSAYIRKGDVNAIYLDWGEEAQRGKLGISIGYIRAVKNTERIGKLLANALIGLRDVGLDLNNVHVIGHSLGAQISGFTGRGVRNQEQILGRVTGLDPARPLYEGIITVKNSINKDCAKFVDIIHSDAGGYGIAETVGTADFWPNYEGKSGVGVQPGCPLGTFPLLSEPGLCSHVRSWMYYLDTIGDCNSYPAASQSDYESWIKMNDTADSIAYMGECITPESKGNYYLVTNDRPPYSKGDDGLYSKNRVSKQ